MKLIDIYEFFIKAGIEADPRGKDLVELDMNRRKKDYDLLSENQKNKFDKESLKNPYYDSRIIYGDPNIEIKTALVGIDVETAELLLASSLKKNSNSGIDLVIAHHPEGYAYSTFSNIVYMQQDILNRQGIPINIAQRLISDRAGEVERSVYPQNNDRVFDAAKLLDIPLMTAHTVADNQVVSFLQKEIDALKPIYLEDIIKFLNKQPEYIYASKVGQEPVIISGDKNSRCGKIFVDMTGGVEGPSEAMEKLSQAGIGTIVGMHLSPKSLKEAKKHMINVVLAGHISSDNLGMNILFDKLEKEVGKISVMEFSGFRRFKRG
jgi:putative NIF3 family GTP cyclohydrolase 1 type 2